MGQNLGIDLVALDIQIGRDLGNNFSKWSNGRFEFQSYFLSRYYVVPERHALPPFQHWQLPSDYIWPADTIDPSWGKFARESQMSYVMSSSFFFSHTKRCLQVFARCTWILETLTCTLEASRRYPRREHCSARHLPKSWCNNFVRWSTQIVFSTTIHLKMCHSLQVIAPIFPNFA